MAEAKKVTLAELEKPVSPNEKEEMRAEILKEMLGDQKLVEVNFRKTLVKRSAATADILNKEKKVIAVWEMEDGEKAGMVETVKINGAVAYVPKGVPILVPESVAKSFKNYKKAEETAGDDIPNSRGGMGVQVGDDERLKGALNL